MTTIKPRTYKHLLDVLTEGRDLPEGCDTWAIRTVHPDFRSQHEYRWPFPGQWAEAPGPIIEDNRDECPSAVGDGICVAHDWEGMASGGVPARTLLLCAYADADRLSRAGRSKVRVRRAFVVDVIDGERLVRENGSGANLRFANLSRANLRGAYLNDADLAGAYISGAYMSGADLSRADLSRADLYSANLHLTNLRGADLRGADLYGATLYNANLTGADLRGANLHLTNLSHANLTGADLRDANLHGAYMPGAVDVSLPDGWEISANGHVQRTSGAGQ